VFFLVSLYGRGRREQDAMRRRIALRSEINKTTGHLVGRRRIFEVRARPHVGFYRLHISHEAWFAKDSISDE